MSFLAQAGLGAETPDKGRGSHLTRPSGESLARRRSAAPL